MTRFSVRHFFLLAWGLLVMGSAQPLLAEDLLVFVSAFTKAADGGGVQTYRLNVESGALKPAHRTGEMENPFFIALSPNRKYLYSIYAPTFGGPGNEQVAAYEITGANGELKLLNRQSSMGTASCYLDVDATGKTVLVANYSSGSVAALPVQADGSLGEPATFIQHKGVGVETSRQAGPHAHCFVISPDNRFAFSADLGLDEVLGYRLDPATAKVIPSHQPFVRTIPRAGPRHLTFHPNGKHIYVINELKSSVTLFDYDTASGMLAEQQTLPTLPKEFSGASYCADVKVTPNGKFLYGTNRGHDSIACYRLDAQGRMTLIKIEPSLGKGPQNLVITPGGELVLCANMPGNNVVVFRINPETGELKAVGEPASLPMPSCIRIR